MGKSEEILDLRKYLPWLDGDGWRGSLRRGLDGLLRLQWFRELVEETERRVALGEEAFAAMLDGAGVGLEEEGVCAAIPKTGGAVVIANHPFGGADAVALPLLCKRVRGDVKILANSDVCGIEVLKPNLLSLEVMGEAESEKRNVRTLIQSMDHVRQGGLLAVFPAGAVSYWQSGSARVEDPPWPDHVARMVGKLGVPVLPVKFHGQNPAWWQILARVHPYLRSGFLPRVFEARSGGVVRCTAGELIGAGEWPEEVGERTRFLREAVERVSGGL